MKNAGAKLDDFKWYFEQTRYSVILASSVQPRRGWLLFDNEPGGGKHKRRLDRPLARTAYWMTPLRAIQYARWLSQGNAHKCI